MNFGFRNADFWKGLGFERNVVVLGLTSTFASFGNLLWWFFLPIIFESQGFSPVEIGLVFSIAAIVSVIIQIPVGAIFVDGWGRKKSIILGGIISSISVAVMGLSNNIAITVIGFIVWDATSVSFIRLARSALIMDSVPKERLASGFGAFLQLAGLLSTASPLIGSFFLERSEQYVIFVLSALLTLGATIVRAVLLREGPTRTVIQKDTLENRANKFGASLKAGLTSIIKSRTILALTLAYAFYNLFISNGSYTFPFVVSLYSKDSLHLSAIYIGIMFALTNLFTTQFSILFGRLADRYPRTKIIIVSWILEMAFMMIFAYSFSPIFALASFSLWVTFGAMDSPALDALIGDITTSERRGISLGFVNTFTNILAIPAVFLTGVFFSISYILPFYANLAIGMVSLVFFIYSFEGNNFGRDSEATQEIRS